MHSCVTIQTVTHVHDVPAVQFYAAFSYSKRSIHADGILSRLMEFLQRVAVPNTACLKLFGGPYGVP